jgi:hypothetical protein
MYSPIMQVKGRCSIITLHLEIYYLTIMDDKEFLTKILKLKAPWYIARVEINDMKTRIDVWVEHEENIVVGCPECDEFRSIYDHSPERVYRHLNICQMFTYIHVRLPRADCPEHGIKQIVSDIVNARPTHVSPPPGLYDIKALTYKEDGCHEHTGNMIGSTI